MLLTTNTFFKNIQHFLFDKNNEKGVIIIAVMIVILIGILVVLMMFNAKKKKYRKSLELLRTRILNLKDSEVIKNYSSYDNLKNDQKLGMLVLRWKKAIENLVREIDAQYSMLDVLDDAIESNNYQYFQSLLESFHKDVDDLELRAEKLHDEIIEYVDMASDNRKYIKKYYEMFKELKERYAQTFESYNNRDKIELFLKNIEKNFTECQYKIDSGAFMEADNTAATIFKDIKTLDFFFDNGPAILNKINTEILPKFENYKNLKERFNDEELEVLNLSDNTVIEKYYEEIVAIGNDVTNFIIEGYDEQFSRISKFLDEGINTMDQGMENRDFIEKNIVYLNDSITKVEYTAKNFVSIFKVVQGSYNITEKEIANIENVLEKIGALKARLQKSTLDYETKTLSFSDTIKQLDISSKELTDISKQLDMDINIIDKIYSDEKNAREKIARMTEKINGTKKYIKYANLENQGKYLTYVKTLNLELSGLYMLLSTFPIDIVRLNKTLETLTEKVNKVTDDINEIIYKTLLTEYVLLYANRYFDNEKYQKELMLAENLFYNNSTSKAYDKVMAILTEIDPNNKKIVLEKYQEKFSEIFN